MRSPLRLSLAIAGAVAIAFGATANATPMTTASVEIFSPDGTIHRQNLPDPWAGYGRQARTPSDPIKADVVQIQHSGPSEDRFDLVFVGDGYTKDEIETYHKNVLQQWKELTKVEPYRTYAKDFNVWQVNVISDVSGVTGDPGQNVKRNTPLGMNFWCQDIERLLCADRDKAYRYAANVSQVDAVMAVANSSKYGGAGDPGSNPAFGTVSGGNAQAGQIAPHEYGHSIGGLADEYTYGGPDRYTGPEIDLPNASILDAKSMREKKTKWADYLGKSTPDGGVIDTFEGSFGSAHGAYRPSNNSLMRSLGRPFNLVSLDIMDKALRSKIHDTATGYPSALVSAGLR